MDDTTTTPASRVKPVEAKSFSKLPGRSKLPSKLATAVKRAESWCKKLSRIRVEPDFHRGQYGLRVVVIDEDINFGIYGKIVDICEVDVSKETFEAFFKQKWPDDAEDHWSMKEGT